MEKDLEKIIERCKQNDHKAFELVYRQYYRALLGTALRYAGNQAEGEDILQDAFIKIFHSIRSFAGKGSFEGWMKRIVQNTAINSFRNKVKYELYIDVSDLPESNDEVMNKAFESFDEKEAISLLNKLPEGYRLVINLYFVDGCSHKEIAEMLGISVGTSKSQLFKAKNYLKTLMETYNYEKIV